MKNEELAAQVSALHIQPGTVVVLSLNLDTPDNFETAKAMAEQLRHAIPHENKLLVLQRPAEIQALDEAQMRELGWVCASGAAQDVLAERQRQVTAEGWTPAHDDTHDNNEMAFAAACYAFHAAAASWDLEDCGTEYDSHPAPKNWPWEPEWWKPKSARSDLVRAGALILAEIERLDRAADKGGAE